MTSGHQILIVEDEMVISMELAQTLKRLGYGIAGQVTRGEDAILKAGMVRPDLVLMDIMLQGEIDGIEAADRIHDLYDIPVVFLTAHSDEATLQRAIAVQPSGYLIKPFRDRELYSTIELSLHKHDLRRRLMPHLSQPLEPEVPGDVPCLFLTPDWIISGGNANAFELLDVSPDSCIRRRFDTLISLNPSLRVTMPDKIYIKKGDGTRIPVLLSLGAITGAGGSISEYVVALTRRDTPA
ncbi:response regulator receiver domain protein (CheY-like) [Methanospirillum hungatei JF-1]|uniref:Response regulator receiver domain protein (CheY-like) n=1 Tax=Methanospirillum hungatei JF-1 (strain ATCC 27890 / DSM 864 / NBRC 100397 / JF-1) TaxID=323259 RepID=Q2FUC5_METHJ|nr:response regulator [Methanospirillum hungatei]ABD40217.1 response regulator receiver domain protein (CheY-like) [Methanospirillum hungatei JF-1]